MNGAEWFSAVFVLEAQHPEGDEDREPLFEKRVVVFEAGNEAEAATKASEYCQAATIEYENKYGEKVVWRCLRTLDITPLYVKDLQDGVEVYSELLDREPDQP